MAALVNTRDTILRVASPRYTNYGVDSQIALINSTLADIASDTKITAAERQALRKEWDVLITEYVNNSNQGLAYLDNLYPPVATYYSNGTTGYADRMQELATYLNAGTTYTMPSLGSSPTDAPNWISNANLSSTATVSITADTFRTKWKQVYDSRTVLINKATDEAGKVANWTGVTSRPYTFRVSARGYSSTQHQLESGLYNGETTSLIMGAGNFWNIAKINRATGAVTNVYNGNDPTNIVTALNGITGSGWIVVVFTYDEPQWLAVNFSTVRNAMYAHGASRAILGSPNFAYRCAYILVGISNCAEGNGFEAYNGVGGSGGSNDWCEVSFYLQNSNLVISGSAATPRTLADYSYIGALNATYGATWGSNITSQPADSSLLNSYVPTGINLIYNSAFEGGLDGWSTTEANGFIPDVGVNFSDTWRLAPSNTVWTSVLYFQQIGGPTNSGYYYGRASIPAPVKQSTRYVLSAYLNMHRCQGVVFVRGYRADGSAIGSMDGAGMVGVTDNNVWSDAKTLDHYSRVVSAFTTTSDCASVVVYVRKYDTLSGASSYLFATRLMLEEAGTNSGASSWADSSRQHSLDSSNISRYIYPSTVGTGYVATSAITQAVSISTSYKNNGNSIGATTKTTQQLLGTITTSSNGDGRVLIFLSGKPGEESVYNYNGWGQILSQSANGGNWLYLRILKLISGSWSEVYRREFYWTGIYNRYIYESASVFNDSPGAGVTVSYYYDIYSVSDYTATHVHYINALTGAIMEVKK